MATAFWLSEYAIGRSSTTVKWSEWVQWTADTLLASLETYSRRPQIQFVGIWCADGDMFGGGGMETVFNDSFSAIIQPKNWTSVQCGILVNVHFDVTASKFMFTRKCYFWRRVFSLVWKHLFFFVIVMKKSWLKILITLDFWISLAGQNKHSLKDQQFITLWVVITVVTSKFREKNFAQCRVKYEVSWDYVVGYSNFDCEIHCWKEKFL